MLILLVEPDTDLADMLVYVLQRDGHDVMTAADEASAVARMLRRTPDAVITELTLPRGSGWSLCKALRAAANIPLLMLGEADTTDDYARVLEAGADAYLSKPISPRLLRAHLHALARRAAPGCDSLLTRGAVRHANSGPVAR